MSAGCWDAQPFRRGWNEAHGLSSRRSRYGRPFFARKKQVLSTFLLEDAGMRGLSSRRSRGGRPFFLMKQVWRPFFARNKVWTTFLREGAGMNGLSARGMSNLRKETPLSLYVLISQGVNLFRVQRRMIGTKTDNEATTGLVCATIVEEYP